MASISFNQKGRKMRIFFLLYSIFTVSELFQIFFFFLAVKKINRKYIERKRDWKIIMAGGGFTDGGPLKRAHLYEYKFTWYFFNACIVAALGGSLFGYDLGVSGN